MCRRSWTPGGVNVLYGPAACEFGSVDDQFWPQDSTDVLDLAETKDHFGSSLGLTEAPRRNPQSSYPALREHVLRTLRSKEPHELRKAARHSR